MSKHLGIGEKTLRKTRRPLGGGAPPGRSRPGGRRAAAERPAGPPANGAPGDTCGISVAPPSPFGGTCCKCVNHYLSATASEDVRNSARGHNKPKKTPPKPTPQESKRNLEIQGICKVFDLERETRQNMQVSYISTVR